MGVAEPANEAEGERDHLKTAPGIRQWLEWPLPARIWFSALLSHRFSLYQGSDVALHFDLEGRLRRAYVRGIHYLRGMDGRVLRKVPTAGRRRVEEELSFSAGELTELYELSHGAVLGAERQLSESPDLSHGGTADAAVAAGKVRDILARASRFSPRRLAEEAVRFRNAYDPIGVLPPDGYRALILQATVGCRYGRCAFCTIYEEETYREKSPAEFREHVRRVKDLFGRALPLKSGVFLGEANALEVPAENLQRIMNIIHEELYEVVSGRLQRGGIAAFSDVFHGRVYAPGEFRQLAALGLNRVYVGVESGDDEVLRRLRKPASAELAHCRVAELKQAGIGVGVIFLVGAAGPHLVRAHIEGSVALTSGLGLDSRDVVYLSRLDSTAIPAGSALLGDSPDPAEVDAEEKELLERLRALGLRVSRYEMGSFVYY